MKDTCVHLRLDQIRLDIYSGNGFEQFALKVAPRENMMKLFCDSNRSFAIPQSSGDIDLYIINGQTHIYSVKKGQWEYVEPSDGNSNPI